MARKTGGRRVAVAAAIAAGIALTLAVALAMAWRRPLAEHVLLARLAQRGLAPASLEVTRFDATGLDVERLRIGEDDLEVDAIETRYALRDLLAGRLDRVRVRGLRARGRIADAGLTFGALDPVLFPEPAGGGGAAPGLPAPDFALEDAEALVETPKGPARVLLGARFQENAAGRIAGRAGFEAETPYAQAGGEVRAAGTFDAFEGEAEIVVSGPALGAEPWVSLEGAFSFRDGNASLRFGPAPFSLELGAADSPLRVEGETPAWSVTGLHVETSGGRARLPGVGVEVSGLVLDAALDPASLLPTGTARLEHLGDAATPRRFPELSLRAEIRSAAPVVSFDAALRDARGDLDVEASGSHDLDAGAGRAELRLQPVVFAEGGLQPRDLAPGLLDEVDVARGTVEAVGNAAWQGESVSGALDLGLRDLTLSGGPGTIERLNAAVHVEGPWPPSTPPHQLVSMARVDAGLVLTDGLVSFALPGDGTLAVESAAWKLAGGTIATEGRFDPGAEEEAAVLDVRGVDLEQLFRLVNLSGLRGSGILGGRIPVALRGDAVLIHGARLEASEEGGWIRYAPDEGIRGAVASTPYFDIVFAALENFHFDELVATLEGDANDAVELSLHLGGSNPDYEKGRRVELNLNVDARLADLLRKGVAAYEIPAEIERRLREIAGEK